MREKSVAVLAAILLASGSTVVLAQPGNGNHQNAQGNQSQSFGQNRTGTSYPGSQNGGSQGQNQPNATRNWVPGPLSPAAANQNGQGQLQGQSRSNQRVLLRQELRQAGFQNIRILDAMFLVQARTGSGQQVIMVVNPPERNDVTNSARPGSSPSSNNQGQNFGSNQSFGAGSDQSQMSAPIMTPGLLDQGQIQSRLQSRGFSEISDLRQDGTTYTGSADWYGEQVDFRVDGRNGFVIEPSHLTPTQVHTMLSDQGWEDIGNIQPQGTSYRVRAFQNGTAYNLWIDARTGQINRQTASNSGNSNSYNSGGQQ